MSRCCGTITVRAYGMAWRGMAWRGMRRLLTHHRTHTPKHSRLPRRGAPWSHHNPPNLRFGHHPRALPLPGPGVRGRGVSAARPHPRRLPTVRGVYVYVCKCMGVVYINDWDRPHMIIESSFQTPNIHQSKYIGASASCPSPASAAFLPQTAPTCAGPTAGGTRPRPPGRPSGACICLTAFIGFIRSIRLIRSTRAGS